jgi:hypothetical protein
MAPKGRKRAASKPRSSGNKRAAATEQVPAKTSVGPKRTTTTGREPAKTRAREPEKSRAREPDTSRPQPRKSVTTKTPTKITITKPLSTHGFSTTKKPRFDKGTKICLDDSIYDSEVPESVRGHLFVYEVCEVHDNGKTVEVVFKEQVIEAAGDRFKVYKEGDDKQVRLIVAIVANCF